MKRHHISGAKDHILHENANLSMKRRHIRHEETLFPFIIHHFFAFTHYICHFGRENADSSMIKRRICQEKKRCIHFYRKVPFPHVAPDVVRDVAPDVAPEIASDVCPRKKTHACCICRKVGLLFYAVFRWENPASKQSIEKIAEPFFCHRLQEQSLFFT